MSKRLGLVSRNLPETMTWSGRVVIRFSTSAASLPPDKVRGNRRGFLVRETVHVLSSGDPNGVTKAAFSQAL